MLIVISSPDAVAPMGTPKLELVKALIEAKAQGNPVGLVSNHVVPSWFTDNFNDTGVQFLQVKGRQNGEIISTNAQKFFLEPHDVLVLAAKLDDIQMGKNGGAVLVAAGWSNDQKVQDLGIRVDSATEFKQVIELSSDWPGHWWFSGNEKNYRIRALADLSTYGKNLTQMKFANKVTNTVKQGGGRLNALLVVTARSLFIDKVAADSPPVWGVYPSSKITKKDSETLSDFTHRLRTTASRSRYAKRDEPLFFRHTPSPKRSAREGGDRTDPGNQIESIHLNPFYENGQLSGKHVIVVDDCTTHGVSFGVAAAFLRKAGAALITCVALGKFGNQLKYYKIEINSDPFRPVAQNYYSYNSCRSFTGTYSNQTQGVLQLLIP